MRLCWIWGHAVGQANDVRDDPGTAIGELLGDGDQVIGNVGCRVADIGHIVGQQDDGHLLRGMGNRVIFCILQGSAISWGRHAASAGRFPGHRHRDGILISGQERDTYSGCLVIRVGARIGCRTRTADHENGAIFVFRTGQIRSCTNHRRPSAWNGMVPNADAHVCRGGVGQERIDSGPHGFEFRSARTCGVGHGSRNVGK